MASSLAQACIPSTFSPSFTGGEILSVQANLVTNLDASIGSAPRLGAPAVELQNGNFCNVTVTYTHPGQNDEINVEAWLPIDNWNGRLQTLGGGGWAAGRLPSVLQGMKGSLAEGFSTMTTDAGVGGPFEADLWAHVSPGNVNMYKLQNFASVALHDETIIGKSLIQSFYGKGPEYSYYVGCSGGGRQGLMLAQRYPNDYDGIAAAAPAIYWTELFPYIYWPQQVMNELGQYPYNCELDAISAEAILTCDGLDGVTDGIVARPDTCLDVFDPFSMVGKTVECADKDGAEVQISKAAAIVAAATWHGPVDANGKSTYGGIAPGSDLTSSIMVALARTECTEAGCVGSPHIFGPQWLKLFAAKDTEMDLTKLSRDEYNRLVRFASQQFKSIIDTSDPDLTNFRDAGGKLITYHGLIDQIIPYKSTERYYNSVAEVTPDIHDFYRYFEVPGTEHCYGGPGGQPTSLVRQLRDWVENGTAPESSPIDVTVSGETHKRILCPYPQKAQFDTTCGKPALEECWSCRGNLALGSARYSKMRFDHLFNQATAGL
ncbi:hypothetical protein V498_02105 [Pseudogymnoascus sp. VKM F-4517 (FW-2822)]|nr:hypothetical protein V498_02105 [Pseudogymnoascus sp. VKM F-4517 (FW-2822)]